MTRVQEIERELAELERAGLRRWRREVDGAQGRRARVDGREVVNFSSNNYLGLAADGRLAAAAKGADDVGTGAGGSRLIVGNMASHRALEEALAGWLGRSALVFNSGYNANVGVLQALAGAEDVVLSDERNHASVIDGCRLSRARVVVYRHRDVGDLVGKLKGLVARRRIIVSDSVFSMDGDVAPVAALAQAAREHGAWLVLDEAHAVGVAGPGGRGIAAGVGVVPDVMVGTLGKAMGSFGAFAIAAAPVIEWLWNRARSFVFTTALPPTVMDVGRAAVEIVGGSEGDLLRARLQRNVTLVRAGLEALGLAPRDGGDTGIFPIRAHDARGAMTSAARLLDAGYYVQGIRPPTVPKGTSRLRLAVMASHTEDDINGVIAAVGELAAQGRLNRDA